MDWYRDNPLRRSQVRDDGLTIYAPIDFDTNKPLTKTQIRHRLKYIRGNMRVIEAMLRQSGPVDLQDFQTLCHEIQGEAAAICPTDYNPV
jgi:hypothetical protein